MTWKIRRDVLEKKTSGRSNSVLEARAVFLYSVLDVRPDVVTDLWAKAFMNFTRLVAHRFRSELVGTDSHEAQAGSDVLNRLLVEAVRKVKASDDSNLTDERILALTFAPFAQIDLDQLEGAFPDWDSLKGSKQMRSVRKTIKDWSVDWNLDAGWCRDHALSVLRHWVADETLKWVFLSPGTKSQLEGKGWQRATSAKIWEVQSLRFGDALSIVGKNLKPFEFRWRGAVFGAPAWNYLKEKDTDWRSRTQLKFIVWLAEKELETIGPIASETASTDVTSMEIDRALTWRYGAMKKFDTALRSYLRSRRLMRKASKSQHKLLEVDKKPKLQEHIEWAVRYQVGGEGLLQVGSGVRAAAGGVQPSTVSRAVEDVLSLVGLLKRPDARPGRIPGRKNRTPRILRELGR
jgi:hypothetical protein